VPQLLVVDEEEARVPEIGKVYVDGSFVTPHGRERFDLYNPSTGKVIGRVRLADEIDTQIAIAAAKRAFPGWSRTSKQERIAALQRLHSAMAAKRQALLEAAVEEYGAPMPLCSWMADIPAAAFQEAADTLRAFEFTRSAGNATVTMEPLGVAGLITPWNGDAIFICRKLAAALAAGCTAVIKPSEMSATQTHVVAEALHAADLPKGVFNIVTGRGDVVGTELSRHPDIAKISFTGSTAVGKTILREAAATLKRVTLELGGKSPSLILEDADLNHAVLLALNAGFLNSGQACTAGTRILVPESRLQEVVGIAKTLMGQFTAGDPRDPATAIGPMVSQRQWDRVQGYIRRGIEEGATVVVGGPGRPEGLGDGYFVRPTLFSDVTNDMTIAREEIFGPVLSFITYRDEAEAILIANDTIYGLQAYVFSSDAEHGRKVASQIVAGRVLVNTLTGDPQAPFGGFKQSGQGREQGTYGLEAYLEPKALIVR
jgi:aldehyde dehydrogenase (NAD+)